MRFTDLFRPRITAATPLPSYDGLVSPWQDQPNYLGSVAPDLLAELYGTTATMLPPTRAEAMGVPSFARGRNVLCATIGRLPIVHMRGATPLPPGEPSPVVQPETGRARVITLAWTVDAMLHYGRAWWVVAGRYQDTDRPRSFTWVAEWNATVAPDGSLADKSTGKVYAPRDVIRIDALEEGVLARDRGTIRAAAALHRSATRTANNPVPTVELHQTAGDELTQPEIDALVRQWIASRNSEHGAVGFTPSSVEARVHGVPVEQLLIEGRKAADLDVARLVGVPAWAVDAPVSGSSMTYSNTPSRSRELIDYGASAYLEAIAGRLSMDDVLPRGQWMRFDTDALLSLDFADRMNAYEVAARSQVYTVEELREKETGVPAETEDVTP